MGRAPQLHAWMTLYSLIMVWEADFIQWSHAGSFPADHTFSSAALKGKQYDKAMSPCAAPTLT